jgi:hypothetical protein
VRIARPPQEMDFNDARLARIMAAYFAHDEDHDLPGRTVRAFVSEFRGLSGTAKARDICEAVGASRLSLAEFYGDGVAMKRGPSVDFCGYWQRHPLRFAIASKNWRRPICA